MADSREAFVNLFGEVVASMRYTGTITASSEVSGVYTLTSENTLINNEWITIDSIDYEVSNVSSTGFTITAAVGLDFTSETWSALAPYYMYGHHREVAKRLSLKDGNATEKFQKWPLIYLVTDIEQQRNRIQNIAYEVPEFSLLILTPTEKTHTAPERTVSTFIPILHPLYYRLIDKILTNRAIATPNNLIEHNQYDRYNWGTLGTHGNEGLILNSNLDAIELTINNLRVYKEVNQCQ